MKYVIRYRHKQEQLPQYKSRPGCRRETQIAASRRSWAGLSFGGLALRQPRRDHGRSRPRTADRQVQRAAVRMGGSTIGVAPLAKVNSAGSNASRCRKRVSRGDPMWRMSLEGFGMLAILRVCLVVGAVAT